MKDGAKTENLISADLHDLMENQSVHEESLLSFFDEITSLCSKGS